MQTDQVISAKIHEMLTRAQLSPEMLQMINSSLNAESGAGELYKWARLTLMNCECVSGVPEVALPGAIAMELSALAADIFDDIQDQDNDDVPWRKIPPANAQNLAICLSMLGIEAFSILPDDRDSKLYKEISQILSQMWITASDGQFQEFLYKSSEQITLEQYFDVVKRKSGSLTACACKIGAILGGASESLVLQLDQFGTNLGIMNQIRNDLNDFLDFERKGDFITNTKTLPVVYLTSILNGEACDRFKEITQAGNKGFNQFGDKERDYLKQITADEGVAQFCTVMYEIFREKAREIINAISVPEKHKKKMIKLVEESV